MKKICTIIIAACLTLIGNAQNLNFEWAKQMGGNEGDVGRSTTTDASGNIYTTGSFQGTIDFNPNSGIYNLTSAGDSDIFIQKLDAAGNFLWAKRMGGTSSDVGYSITIDANRNIYTAGYFNETVDFDPDSDVQNLTSSGGQDIFIQKLNQCTTITGIDTQTACNAYTWIDGNTYNSNNNTAIFSIIGGATNGCDSIVTLDLTIENIYDTTIHANDLTISANNNHATYQWLDCNDSYSPLSGEINQNFVATMNGSYAVELTENGCVDTSACVIITTVGIDDSYLENQFVVSPNPTKGDFNIKFDNFQKNISTRLYTPSGELIKNNTFQNTNLIQEKITHPPGIYILEIIDIDRNKATLKLLKI